MLTIIIVGLLFLQIALGAPIAIALGVSGMIGLYALGGMRVVMGIFETAPHSSITGYELITIPMFILMAEFAIVSGIADELFGAIRVWVGRLRGGLAVSTGISGALFGAICGSSSASAATLASTSIPVMIRNNYKADAAYGLVAISGTLAMLIPPSVSIILYGIIAEQSIAQLLVAGIIPGLIVLATIIATFYLLVWIDPETAPRGERTTSRAKIGAFKIAAPFLFLFIAVTGFIYLGIATPTESAAMGAAGSLLIALVRRKLTIARFVEAVKRGAATSAMIFMIIMSAHIFTYFMTLTQTTQKFVGFVIDLDLPAWLVMLVIIAIYLVLGFFMDQVAILILTVPLVLPLVVELGFNPIWFGILIIVIAEVGMVTPPLGLNAFIVARYAGVPVQRVFVGVAPHVVAHLLVIALMAIFPRLILWLPSTMGR
jgi:C4-dicarboxylate transporter, DctM subunit